MISSRIRTAALLAPILTCHAFLVQRLWFVCDDAYITWRFSYHWANGNGIRYNLGGDLPVEGYSNFLWMVLAAAYEWLALDLAVWVPLTSSLIASGFLVYVFWAGQKHFGFTDIEAALSTSTLAVAMPFDAWSSGGLATLPFAALIFAYFERTVLAKSWRWAVAAGIGVALIRTEGIAWVAVISLIAAATSSLEGRRADLKGLCAAIGAIAGLFAVYYGWRFSHYDSWVSNTAYAKIAFDMPRVMRGVDYVTHYHLVFLAPLVHYIGAFPMIRKYGWRGFAVVLMAIGFPAYAIVISGDYMTSGRVLVPGIAFGALLLGALIH